MTMANDPFFARLLEQLTAPGAGYAQADNPGQSSAQDLDLQVGEVRYPLPAELSAEIGDAAAAMDKIWYSDPIGLDSLRNAYLAHLVGEVGTVGNDEAVLITAGGKEAAFLAVRYLLCLRGAGPALVPRPGWQPYSFWLDAAACPQIPYDPAAAARDPNLLRDLVTQARPAPTLLIVNYPNNPTGVHVTQQQMDQIIEIAAELGLAVVSDEVYRAFAEDPVSAAHAPARDPRRHLIVDSCSKAWAVAGLRVGFLTAAPAVVQDLTAFRSAYASCTSALTQHVAELLLTSTTAQQWLSQTRTAVERDRRDTAQALADHGITVNSHGGLYIWCRTPPSQRPRPASGLRARFTSGTGFGIADHVRLCTARAGLDPLQAAAAVATTLRGR